jgi:hypothetical protein
MGMVLAIRLPAAPPSGPKRHMQASIWSSRGCERFRTSGNSSSRLVRESRCLECLGTRSLQNLNWQWIRLIDISLITIPPSTSNAPMRSIDSLKLYVQFAGLGRVRSTAAKPSPQLSELCRFSCMQIQSLTSSSYSGQHPTVDEH